MPTFTIKRRSQEERERCAALVRNYRESLEHVYQKWTKNPPPHITLIDKHKLAIIICEAVTKSLEKIEREIANPSPASGSEFSLDELEAAERMIAEQDHNPFEG